ncbi:MAG: amidohydrolase family protein [Candidatus Sumerlaeia bacterium]
MNFENKKDHIDCLVSAATIIQDADRLLLDGAMQLHRGRIVRIGRRSDFPVKPDMPVYDFGDAVLFPGLVNAHVHLEYGGLMGQIKPGPFVDWLPQIIAARSKLESRQIQKDIADGIRMLVEGGVTTLADIASFDLSTPWLEQAGMRYICFLEVINLAPPPYDDFIKALHGRMERQASGPLGQIGLSPHAPYSVSAGLMECLRRQMHFGRDIPFAMHVAEFPEEIEFLAHRSGPLARFFREMPHPQWEYIQKEGWLAKSPMEFLNLGRPFGSVGDLAIHGNYLDEEAIAKLAAEGRTSLVICPGTRLHHGVDAPGPKWAQKHELPLALGTDSLASNNVLSIWEEMSRSLECIPQWSARDAFDAATAGGARALGMRGRIGRLLPNYEADFVAAEKPEGMELENSPEPLLERWIGEGKAPEARDIWVCGKSLQERPFFRRKEEDPA